MKKVLRTSEFWTGVGGIVGAVLAATGAIEQSTWDKLWPAISVYILGRVSGKAARGSIPEN